MVKRLSTESSDTRIRAYSVQEREKRPDTESRHIPKESPVVGMNTGWESRTWSQCVEPGTSPETKRLLALSPVISPRSLRKSSERS